MALNSVAFRRRFDVGIAVLFLTMGVLAIVCLVVFFKTPGISATSWFSIWSGVFLLLGLGAAGYRYGHGPDEIRLIDEGGELRIVRSHAAGR